MNIGVMVFNFMFLVVNVIKCDEIWLSFIISMWMILICLGILLVMLSSFFMLR